MTLNVLIKAIYTFIVEHMSKLLIIFERLSLHTSHTYSHLQILLNNVGYIKYAVNKQMSPQSCQYLSTLYLAHCIAIF